MSLLYFVYKATMEAESRFASLNAQDFKALVANKTVKTLKNLQK